jgi:DNA polymerase III subunit delta
MSLHLLKSASKIPLTPIVALIGPEAFVRKVLREDLVKRALGASLKEMNFSQFQAGEDEMARVMDACRDYPCFSEKRVVLLRDVGKLRKKEAEEFVGYLKNPQPSTILIVEDEKVDGRLDWVKGLKKHAQWIEVLEASPEDALSWVRNCFQKEGKKAGPEVAERLVDWVGTSLGALQVTVTQLALYVGDAAEVSLEDLETLLVKVTDENIFEVIDAVFAGRLSDLHHSLDALLEAGEAPLKILALVYRHLAILLTLRYSKNPYASDLLRMGPAIRRKYEMQAKRYQRQLKLSLLGPVARADIRLKLSPLSKSLVLKHCVEEIVALLADGRDELRQA